MARRQRVKPGTALRHTLNAFLQKFVGRGTEYQGYWLFGFLFDAELLLSFDLLGPSELYSESAVDHARFFAVSGFELQCADSGVSRKDISAAGLRIIRPPERSERLAGNHPRRGCLMSFEVEVVTISGETLRLARSEFVAPHDPSLEARSGRLAWQETETEWWTPEELRGK